MEKEKGPHSPFKLAILPYLGIIVRIKVNPPFPKYFAPNDLNIATNCTENCKQMKNNRVLV